MTDVRQHAEEAAALTAALVLGAAVVAASITFIGGDSFADGLVAGIFGTAVVATVLVSAGRDQR